MGCQQQVVDWEKSALLFVGLVADTSFNLSVKSLHKEIRSHFNQGGHNYKN